MSAQLTRRPCWIFDLDGTLTVAAHDFDAIRAELGLPQGRPILEALLASVSASESIVDHRFSMPSPVSGKAGASEWDRAVSRRLEIRLANTMRTRLNSGE